MFLLDSFEDNLQLITYTDARLDVRASYEDWDGIVSLSGNQYTQIGAASVTQIVSPPQLGIKRRVQSLAIRNSDLFSPSVCMLAYNDGTELMKGPLAVGDQLTYTSETGWKTLTSLGGSKSLIVTDNLVIQATLPTFPLEVQAGTLGNLAGNTLDLLKLQGYVGNSHFLRAYLNRVADGVNHNTAEIRLQEVIDISNRSFIAFRSDITAPKLVMGFGAVDRLTLFSDGFTTLGSTVKRYLFSVHGALPQFQISNGSADSGVFLLALAENHGYISIGSNFNGTNWIAKSTLAALSGYNTGGWGIWIDSGLTVGNSYTPTARFAVANGGGTTIGSPTGGENGSGTLNTASDIYTNNVKLPLMLSATRPNAGKTNSVTTDQDYASIFTIPANTISTGVWLEVRLHWKYVSGSLAPTYGFYLKLGGTKVYTPSLAVNATAVGTYYFTMIFYIIGTAAVGAAVAVDVGIEADWGTGDDHNVTGPQNLATNGTLTIVPGITFSATGSTETLTLLDASVTRLNG